MIHNASVENKFRLHMIDINDFKLVNDKFGHIVGDRTLQLVADAIHNVSDRMHGFCARYGGDEFVMITKDNAEILTELQNEVNSLRENCADLIPMISVCSGYATCSSGAMTATQLIAQADEELYVKNKIYHGKGDSAKNKE